MAKSMIVVLSVTPNLTEPENFIIQHEYPEAVKQGKEIIPAELLSTDMEALKRLFPEIPVVVDGTSIEAVEFALRNELKKIGLTENDTNPEHNYLIGLAYLGGIDIERDAQRAAELIKSAAERELPEAIKKLADMYHDGDGVERSYEEELVWLIFAYPGLTQESCLLFKSGQNCRGCTWCRKWLFFYAVFRHSYFGALLFIFSLPKTDPGKQKNAAEWIRG